MKKTQQTYTPRGLTQNWSFFEENSKARKGRKGGPFVSRNRVQVHSEPASVKVEEREVDPTNFTVNVKDSGEVKVQPRKNGKFSGKQQVYSESLARKLELV